MPINRGRGTPSRPGNNSQQPRRASTAQPKRKFWTPTADSVRKQMDRSRTRFDNPFRGDMLTAKMGDNTVRILPPTWEDPDHYSLSVWEHRYVGPDQSHYLCLRRMRNETCPICEAERESRDRGDQDGAKKLKAMQRWACYVLHRQAEDDRKIFIWDMNGYQDEEIVSLTRDRKTNALLPVTDIDNGYDLSYRRTGQGDRTRYGGFQFDRDPSPIHDDPNVVEEVLREIEENPLDSRLRYFEADYLESMMYGTTEAKDEDLDNEETAEEEPEEEEAQQDAPWDEDTPPEDEGGYDEESGEEQAAEEGEYGEEPDVKTTRRRPQHEPETRAASRGAATRERMSSKSAPRQHSRR